MWNRRHPAGNSPAQKSRTRPMGFPALNENRTQYLISGPSQSAFPLMRAYIFRSASVIGSRIYLLNCRRCDVRKYRQVPCTSAPVLFPLLSYAGEGLETQAVPKLVEQDDEEIHSLRGRGVVKTVVKSGPPAGSPCPRRRRMSPDIGMVVPRSDTGDLKFANAPGYHVPARIQHLENPKSVLEPVRAENAARADVHGVSGNRISR